MDKTKWICAKIDICDVKDPVNVSDNRWFRNVDFLNYRKYKTKWSEEWCGNKEHLQITLTTDTARHPTGKSIRNLEHNGLVPESQQFSTITGAFRMFILKRNVGAARNSLFYTKVCGPVPNSVSICELHIDNDLTRDCNKMITQWAQPSQQQYNRFQ